MISQNPILPPLRPDLSLHPGPTDPDGSPTWTLHDPLTRSFTKLGWAETRVVECLQRAMTPTQVLEKLKQDTPLELSPSDILNFSQQAQAQGLTTATLVRPPETLDKMAQKTGIISWLLRHYIYFRIPLLRPEKFLLDTHRRVAWLGSVPMRCLMALAFVVGVIFTLLNWEHYLTTFSYFFNFQGMAAFVTAAVLVKVLHEFSHAYTAAGFGVRVPVMGVAMIVMWPVAYCDVTDAWKLSHRRKRLMISGAGIACELCVAGMALLGWLFTSPGVLNSIFFFLSSTSLVSTLLVNINPAMRFDGYFMLMDLWGIDNLQPRAMGLTQWLFHRYIWGMDLPCPEPDLSSKHMAGMVLYALYAWAYRVILILSIALVVYHAFFKALGLILFSVEIWFFLLAPAVRNLKQVWEMRSKIRVGPKNLPTLVLITMALAGFILPLPGRIALPGVIQAGQEQIIYLPRAGQLTTFDLTPGRAVLPNQVLAHLHSTELDARIKILELEKQILTHTLQTATLDEKTRSMAEFHRRKIQAVDKELGQLHEIASQHRITSHIQGRIYGIKEDLHPGIYLGAETELARMGNMDHPLALAFVSEEEVNKIQVGQGVVFFSRARPLPIRGKVSAVSPMREIRADHPALTSLTGGDLPVVSQRDQAVFVDSRYLVTVDLSPGSHKGLAVGQPGKIWIRQAPHSRAWALIQRGINGLIRETGF